MHTAILLSGSANRHLCCCYCSRHPQPRKVACRPLLTKLFITGALKAPAPGWPHNTQTPDAQKTEAHETPATQDAVRQAAQNARQTPATRDPGHTRPRPHATPAIVSSVQDFVSQLWRNISDFSPKQKSGTESQGSRLCSVCMAETSGVREILKSTFSRLRVVFYVDCTMSILFL